MPNHCENDLWLCGDRKEVAAVLELIGMLEMPSVFDFRRVIPEPEQFETMDREHAEGGVGYHAFEAPGSNLSPEAREVATAAYKARWGTDKDGFNSGGYDWRVKAWGTKWGAYDVERRDSQGRVCISFETAWSPPLPVIRKLIERFPNVEFSLDYFERGAAFSGGLYAISRADFEEQDEDCRENGRVREWHSNGYRGVRGG